MPSLRYSLMAFPVEVSTLGGEVYQVHVREDWSLWKFKYELEKLTGAHVHLQRLINDEGVELLTVEYPFLDYCSPENGTMHLTMAQMSKSTAETEWFEKWQRLAPQWLKSFADEVMDSRSLSELDINVPGLVGGVKGVMPGNNPHSTKMVVDRQCAKVSNAPAIVATGREVLSMLKKPKRGKSIRGKLYLSGISIDREMVTLRWSQYATKHTVFDLNERVATLEAVIDAVLDDPDVFFDSPFVGIQDLIELAMSAMRRCPDIFYSLPSHVQREEDVFFAALDALDEFRDEFLRTADQRELRQWRERQWRAQMG